MATQEGIMAQIYVAFGQGTGAIRVSQEAALELHRWYFNAITPEIINQHWASQASAILDRIRAIGTLAALKATLDGSPTVRVQDVYSAALQVQAKSDTDFCPPPPPPLPPLN